MVAEAVEAQRAALLVLLDVFAAREAREQEALAARWSKKSAAALMDAARANGLPVGKKMDMIAALAEKGIQPDAS